MHRASSAIPSGGWPFTRGGGRGPRMSPRRRGIPASRALVRRPIRRRRSRSHVRGQRPGRHCGDLPTPRRPSAGDRACRRLDGPAVSAPTPRRPERDDGRPHYRRRWPTRQATDPPRDHGLELLAAGRAYAAGVSRPIRLPRRLHRTNRGRRPRRALERPPACSSQSSRQRTARPRHSCRQRRGAAIPAPDDGPRIRPGTLGRPERAVGSARAACRLLRVVGRGRRPRTGRTGADRGRRQAGSPPRRHHCGPPLDGRQRRHRPRP